MTIPLTRSKMRLKTLISIIEKDASILRKWLNDNYLKLNEDNVNCLLPNTMTTFLPKLVPKL